MGSLKKNRNNPLGGFDVIHIDSLKQQRSMKEK
jgi:hypothetical protein